MEAAPGSCCGECPARCAPQGAAKGTASPAGALGRCRWQKTLPWPPQRGSGTPSLPSTRGGGEPGALSFLPPLPMAGPSPTAPLALGLGAPGPLRGGFSEPPCPGGVLPLRCGVRQDGGRSVLGTEAAFLGHPTLSFYPMAMKGVPVGPGGGPVFPPPRAPPSFSAPPSAPQALLLLPRTPVNTETPPWGLAEPKHRPWHSRAPPASPTPFAGKKSSRGAHLRGEEGTSISTQPQHPSSFPGENGTAGTAPQLGRGTRGASKASVLLCATAGLRSVPGTGRQSPSLHLNPRLSEMWGLFSCKAAWCSHLGKYSGVPVGFFPAPGAAPLPRPPSSPSWHRRRAALSLRRFWERAGIAAAHQTNSPAQSRLQPGGYF